MTVSLPNSQVSPKIPQKRKITFLVSCTEGHLAINPEEISYCEVSGKKSSKWHFKNELVTIVKLNLRQSAKLLLSHHFAFTNPSTLINLHEVFQITQGMNPKLVLINGKQLSVSVRKRREILEKLKTIVESKE